MSYLEKKGLVRSIEFLKKKNFDIQTLVTGRHKQIGKWARESILSTNHCYDIWHL